MNVYAFKQIAKYLPAAERPALAMTSRSNLRAILPKKAPKQIKFDNSDYLLIRTVPSTIDLADYTKKSESKTTAILTNSSGNVLSVSKHVAKNQDLMNQGGRYGVVLCCGGRFTLVVFKDGVPETHASDARYV